jgi:hypothetical protein
MPGGLQRTPVRKADGIGRTDLPVFGLRYAVLGTFAGYIKRTGGRGFYLAGVAPVCAGHRRLCVRRALPPLARIAAIRLLKEKGRIPQRILPK